MSVEQHNKSALFGSALVSSSELKTLKACANFERAQDPEI